MGGLDKVKRQHDGGELTVRERVDGLLDRGAVPRSRRHRRPRRITVRTGARGTHPLQLVIGRGVIDGRRVVVVGDDFTVRGGGDDGTMKVKRVLAELMAHELRLPLVRLVDGSGGGGSVKTIETTGRANLPGGLTTSTLQFQLTTGNMGIVPIVGLGLD